MPHLRRFFADSVEHGTAVISGREARHIFTVLRKRPGDDIVAVCGGTEYECTITAAEEAQVLAEVKSSAPCTAEPRVDITLYMACCKADKMELVAQKAAEIGASAFVPFIASRCVKIPSDPQKAQARQERIVYEAMKQCGRSATVSIETPVTFAELLSRIAQHDSVIFAYEESTGDLRSALHEAHGSIALIVGCEGGFTPQEAAAITAAGASNVSLGPRIMRAETAAIALMAIACYETGC